MPRWKVTRGRIGGNELDFVDADGRILTIAERFLDLLDEVLRARPSHGEGIYQTLEVLQRDLGGEEDAGQTGGGEQLSKASLRCPVSSGMPSRSSLFSETPSTKPPSPVLGNACWSSADATSSWSSVRLWLVPYKRVYLIRMFRLWRKARADALRLASTWAAFEMVASSAVIELWLQGYAGICQDARLRGNELRGHPTRGITRRYTSGGAARYTNLGCGEASPYAFREFTKLFCEIAKSFL